MSTENKLSDNQLRMWFERHREQNRNRSRKYYERHKSKERERKLLYYYEKNWRIKTPNLDYQI